MVTENNPLWPRFVNILFINVINDAEKYIIISTVGYKDGISEKMFMKKLLDLLYNNPHKTSFATHHKVFLIKTEIWRFIDST